MLRILSNSGVSANKAKTLINRLINEQSLRNALITQNYCKSITNPDGLPRLPVPYLEDTLKRFLITTEPFLTKDEYQTTKNLCRDFEKGVGAKLQNYLIERSNKREDWMAEWWVKYAYLAYRDPVVVYSNPGLAFPKFNIKNLNDQIDYAARMVFIALQYKKLVDDNKIPQEKMGKALLDMGQYNRIFGTCRIPARDIDKIEYHPTSKHIGLFYKNNAFKIPVYGGPSGTDILSVDELIEQFRECIAKVKGTVEPVGILSTEQRDNYAIAYEALIKDSRNLKSVREIQTSLFTVSIDDRLVPNQNGEYDTVAACHQLITGGGSTSNSGNRWFDKTIQIVIGQTGIAGVTYEHTPAEGQPVAIMIDRILSELDKIPPLAKVGNITSPTKLDFNITPDIQVHIDNAKRNIDILAGNLDMDVLHFTDYGKGFIKKQKVSPDSYIQMAIQYAFYRLHKTPGAHYESAHTRLYIHGRTETIRSCSPESIAFAKSMLDSTPDAERVKLLRQAIQAHKDYTALALQGQGVDRHFFALKHAANENKIPLHPLYSDPGYVRSLHMRLSTSQVASKYESFMCYGTLTEDGYGCCYNPRENDMFFGISSMKTCKETDAATFGSVLAECFREMRSLLERATDVKAVQSKL